MEYCELIQVWSRVCMHVCLLQKGSQTLMTLAKRDFYTKSINTFNLYDKENRITVGYVHETINVRLISVEIWRTRHEYHTGSLNQTLRDTINDLNLAKLYGGHIFILFLIYYWHVALNCIKCYNYYNYVNTIYIYIFFFYVLRWLIVGTDNDM